MSKKLEDVRAKKVTVELKGSEYALEYNLNSFAEIEHEFGTIDELMNKLSEGRATVIRAVLWAGLISNHPELTIKDVGSLISFSDIPRLSSSIFAAITGALPQGEGEPEKNE